MSLTHDKKGLLNNALWGEAEGAWFFGKADPDGVCDACKGKPPKKTLWLTDTSGPEMFCKRCSQEVLMYFAAKIERYRSAILAALKRVA